ncbi:MAG: N-6 DNA methylase, partial [Phycisphaerales bacterium]|nr:N-6 DNA methylase [Phycisphaerales bacterium]
CQQLNSQTIDTAHMVIVRWADMELSGKLAKMTEEQLEGAFYNEVLVETLGYTPRTADEQDWHLDVKGKHGTIGTPDASIGRFREGGIAPPTAILELKGPKVHLDRDRSNGRTAVQQCWDYLSDLPETRWGIVSNIVSFRLYERNHTRRRYEHYALQDLRDKETFARFYATLGRQGLLDRPAGNIPVIDRLLVDTDTRQKEAGDKLYDLYRLERHRLIDHLIRDHRLPLDDAIESAQRLMDRILFIAFCEDRELLPRESLHQAHGTLPPFTKATNPRWRNFIDLFRAVDSGTPDGRITGYNGGLFAKSSVDDLDLDDRWTNFFQVVGTYDFADEVNLDVLGHLFEKSITELEKLREGDLFGDAASPDRYAAMPKSAKQKRLGVYYTPPAFTAKINELTVDDLLTMRFNAAAETLDLDPKDADTPEFWNACLDILSKFRVIDPACGSGAFLFQAYEVLEARYFEVLGHLERLGKPGALPANDVPDRILANNLYGVDLSPEAVEITQLALWIRTARPGRKLTDLDHNIHCGNSLVSDPAADERAFDWHTQFPEVFG